MNGNGTYYGDTRCVIFKDLDLGEVRTHVDENGELWFFEDDVARILGIKKPRDVSVKLRKTGFAWTLGLTTKTVKMAKQDEKIFCKEKEMIIKRAGLMFVCCRTRNPNGMKLFKFVSDKIYPSLIKYVGYTITPGDEKVH